MIKTKLIYITSLDMDARTGAQSHVLEISNGLKNHGFEVRLVAYDDFRGGTLHAIRRKISMASLVRRAIREFSPEIAYVRYSSGDFLSVREILKRDIPCVIELNSKDIPEMMSTRRFIPLMVGIFTDPWTFRNVNGVAAVTHEIYQYAGRLGGVNKPFLLAKNCASMEYLSCYPSNVDLRIQHDTPKDARLVAFIGSIAPWHGVDKLLSALGEPNMENYYLWVIGNAGREEIRSLANNSEVMKRVRIFPWQQPDKLSELLSCVDMGIGALAMHRKNMIECQALKARTYLATGTPTLLGYHDPLIPGDLPFVSPGITMNAADLASEIVIFCDFIENNRESLRAEARNFALKNLSWDIAVRETADFIREIHERRT